VIVQHPTSSNFPAAAEIPARVRLAAPLEPGALSLFSGVRSRSSLRCGSLAFSGPAGGKDDPPVQAAADLGGPDVLEMRLGGPEP
jgi:hypothetical protein